ncbi:MAG: hypothetical protein ABI743_00205 [bacterium]
MSETLRYVRALMGELGARLAPEAMPLPLPAAPKGDLRPVDQGSVETTPRAFSFFLSTVAQAFVLGEVASDNGSPIPVSLLSLACGVIARDGTALSPYLRPAYGLVIALPASLGEAVGIERYRGVGITPILAGDPSQARGDMIAAQLHAMRELVDDTKESVFQHWHESAGVAGHQILVEGSLQPTAAVMKLGSWTGIRTVEQLTSLEEQAALGLPVGSASVPFGFEGSGGYWYARLATAERLESSEGLLRLETAFVNDEHVASKVTALTQAVTHERFPVVPRDHGAVPLYPLTRARAYLQTFITSPRTVVQAL